MGHPYNKTLLPLSDESWCVDSSIDCISRVGCSIFSNMCGSEASLCSCNTCSTANTIYIAVNFLTTESAVM